MQRNTQLVFGSLVAVLLALSLGIGIYYFQPQTTSSTALITTSTVTTTTSNPASGNAPYLLMPAQLVTSPTNSGSTLLLILTNLGNTSIVLNNIVLLENSSSSSHLIQIAKFGVTGKGSVAEYVGNGTMAQLSGNGTLPYGFSGKMISSANLTGVTIVPSGMTNPPTTTCTTGTDISNVNGTTTTEIVSVCGQNQQGRAGGTVVLLWIGYITTSSGTTFVAAGGQQCILELEGNFGSEYISVIASHIAGPNSTTT